MSKAYPQIMTIAEVAELLRIGKNAAYALVKEGKIPSIKIGNQIRIYRKDVYAFFYDAKRETLAK